jgi:hypothetical protein
MLFIRLVFIALLFFLAGVAQANDRDSRSALAEVGGGVQITAAGPRFLVAVGTSGMTLGERSTSRSSWRRARLRLFWAQARMAVDSEANLAYADIELIPASYEETFGEDRSYWRAEMLPAQYQRELSLGLGQRVSAYLLGFQVHADLRDPMESDIGCILRDSRYLHDFSAYLDFVIRGAGAVYTRFTDRSHGAGVAIGHSELAVGGAWEPIERYGHGWLVRLELARGRVALDAIQDLQTGSWNALVQVEVMSRLAVGYRFPGAQGGVGPEIEFSIRGGVRAHSGAPGVLPDLPADGQPGSLTPVFEAGIGGRF